MIACSHSDFLHEALQLAMSRRGYCAPNPAVGAVLVKNNIVLSRGRHWASGSPHAEVDAFNQFEGSAEGATLYVTLEPCCHVGKTPACTEAIIAKKIARVVYGYEDPNPLVHGKGQALLNNAGIICEKVDVPAINSFYQSYAFWQKTKRPFMNLKLALSLDGKIAGEGGAPFSLTGNELATFTHQKRNMADALLTSANTICHDNPQFTARLENETVAKPLFIIDAQLKIPADAAIFNAKRPVFIFHDETKTPSTKIPAVEYIPLKYTHGFDLSTIADIIGNKGFHDLWIEVGSTLFSEFLRQDLIQRVFVYIAPKILGEKATPGFTTALPLFEKAKKIRYETYGNDILVEMDLCSPA